MEERFKIVQTKNDIGYNIASADKKYLLHVYVREEEAQKICEFCNMIYCDESIRKREIEKRVRKAFEDLRIHRMSFTEKMMLENIFKCIITEVLDDN